ncbi:hypothetical protein K469DRAFT_368203 [Zopfia rhizophila CBS 207.26]|uniref:Uncharacterized protein n=1 Tax=Zopfia rhizophila CBS 207.26 TaxID=1314779 RepID=A0A6A6EHX5_9PEZI|nr:hypothetical protein K469DRAFT_368203 [Zopfia rhizophila CBS 207.26]
MSHQSADECDKGDPTQAQLKVAWLELGEGYILRTGPKDRYFDVCARCWQPCLRRHQSNDLWGLYEVWHAVGRPGEEFQPQSELGAWALWKYNKCITTNTCSARITFSRLINASLKSGSIIMRVKLWSGTWKEYTAKDFEHRDVDDCLPLPGWGHPLAA